MSRKLALLIGNSEYEDKNLARLRTPSADVNALAEVLRDTEIGGFDEVTPLINQPNDVIREAIVIFFSEKNRDDLLLLYFAGHGVLDNQGRLYLAVKDTKRGDLLRAKAIPATFITQEMDNSNSRRQVLILDCCNSGAFARGTRGAPGASVGTAAAFEGNGYGRVVLTATDTTQYAWEGDEVIGEAENSVFTYYLIKGLQTGEADADTDGQITLDELYDYVYSNKTPKQTPGKWAYKQQGEIIIARNPHPVVKPAELPAELRQSIEDPRPWVREGAVHELDRLLRGSDKGLALAAQECLKRLTEDDSRRVSTAAAKILSAYGEVQGIREEQVGVERKADVTSLAPEQREELKRTAQETTEQSPVQRDVETKAKIKIETEQLTVERMIPENLLWLSLFLTIIGWGIGPTVTWKFILPDADGWPIGWGGWPIGWAIGGLITGLILRWTKPSLQWKQIFTVAIGWGIAGLIGVAITDKTIAGIDMGTVIYKTLWSTIEIRSDWYIYWSVGWGISGVIGGLVTGLALWWTKFSLQWKQILTVATGWGIAGCIGGLMPYYIDRQIVGAAIGITIAGAIGNGIIFWHFSRERRSS